MNTLNKRQEHRQVQQQKANEIWDKQTEYIRWLDLHNDDRKYKNNRRM